MAAARGFLSRAADRSRPLRLRAGARPPSSARRRRRSPRSRYDTVGSTVARVPGTAGGPSLAVVGHIDEIGLIVHHIDDDGFLWFTGVGGWDPIVLVGQRVEIATRGGVVPGVVGKKPIHLMKDDDRKKVPLLKDLHIDIGAAGGDEARAAGAHRRRRGDRRRAGRVPRQPLRLALDGQPARLLRGAGGGAARGRGGRRARRRVRASRSRRRRSRFGGARTTAYSLRPDVAIAVDVTFATDQPGHRREGARAPPASAPGAVLTRGSTLDPRVFELLHETGRGRGHPVHRHRLGARPRAPTRTRSTSRAQGIPSARGLGAAALHALAGGDGAARRRRGARAADRGVRAAAAGGRRLRAAEPCCSCCSTSTARCSSAPRWSTRSRCATRRARCTASTCSTSDASSTRGARTARSRAICWPPSGVDRGRRRVGGRRAPCAAYERLCPDDLSAQGRAGDGRAARGAGRAARRVPAVARSPGTSSRSRGSSSRAAGIGHYFERRPGRLRLRRRGPRAAAGDRARPRPRHPPWPRERTVVIGDTPRDIALRAGGRGARGGGGHGPVRGGGAGRRGRRRRRRPLAPAGPRRLVSTPSGRALRACERQRTGHASAVGVSVRTDHSRGVRGVGGAWAAFGDTPSAGALLAGEPGCTGCARARAVAPRTLASASERQRATRARERCLTRVYREFVNARVAWNCPSAVEVREIGEVAHASAWHRRPPRAAEGRVPRGLVRRARRRSGPAAARVRPHVRTPIRRGARTLTLFGAVDPAPSGTRGPPRN